VRWWEPPVDLVLYRVTVIKERFEVNGVVTLYCGVKGESWYLRFDICIWVRKSSWMHNMEFRYDVSSCNYWNLLHCSSYTVLSSYVLEMNNGICQLQSMKPARCYGSAINERWFAVKPRTFVTFHRIPLGAASRFPYWSFPSDRLVLATVCLAKRRPSACGSRCRVYQKQFELSF
jgi:hypothetical protein